MGCPPCSGPRAHSDKDVWALSSQSLQSSGKGMCANNLPPSVSLNVTFEMDLGGTENLVTHSERWREGGKVSQKRGKVLTFYKIFGSYAGGVEGVDGSIPG